MAKFIKTCGITILVGIALIILGLCMKKDTDDYTLNMDLANVELKDEEELNGIKDIDIDIPAGKIEVVKGEVSKIEVSASKNTVLPEDYKKIEDGKLKIDIDSNGAIAVIKLTLSEEIEKLDLDVLCGEVEVFEQVTKDLKVEVKSGKVAMKDINGEKISVDNALGEVEASNIMSKNIDIKQNAGKVVMKEVTSEDIEFDGDKGEINASNITTKRLNSKVSMGHLDIRDINAESVKADVNMGDANISGDIENVDVKVSMGNANIFLDKEQNEYRVSSRAVLGSIMGYDDEIITNEETYGTVDVNVSLGNANLIFGKTSNE